jgi:hypothetical protein
MIFQMQNNFFMIMKIWNSFLAKKLQGNISTLHPKTSSFSKTLTLDAHYRICSKKQISKSSHEQTLSLSNL